MNVNADSDPWLNPPTQVTLLIGTRPEAIKMAPVFLTLRETPGFSVDIRLSGQHRSLCADALADFGITAARVVGPPLADFSLAGQAAHFLQHLGQDLKAQPADLVLVHGDTTTGFIGALAAFYARIPVGHVEAGLRSGDLDNPFPEEANRRLIAPLCQLLFAPTPRARKNLLQEGIARDRILVTGNTVVDALARLEHQLPAFATLPAFASLANQGCRLVLVTAHRRENWGEPMRQICLALVDLVTRFQDVAILFPVHPNPAVREVVHAVLPSHPRILLTEPLAYLDLMVVLREACLALTDSGGIQEEAPSMQTPVLVLRSVTERPEGVEAGAAKLVGSDREHIVAECSRLLADQGQFQQMIAPANPFGDGKAAVRIAKGIDRWRRGASLDEDHWSG